MQLKISGAVREVIVQWYRPGGLKEIRKGYIRLKHVWKVFQNLGFKEKKHVSRSSVLLLLYNAYYLNVQARKLLRVVANPPDLKLIFINSKYFRLYPALKMLMIYFISTV